MRDFLAVALGGTIGSVARHAVNLVSNRAFGPTGWSFSTLVVNVLGCFAIGIFSVLAKRYGWLDSSWELAVRVGFLGGLTTFSSFGLEVFQLWQDGRPMAAAFIVAGNVFLGIGAVALGAWVARFA
jgi:CrcB protein